MWGGGFLCCPLPSLAVSGGCLSVPKDVGCADHSSPSSQGLRSLRSWALPTQGYPDSRKALRKGRGKVDHSALSRSVQQGCGIMRSYIYKMHLFRVLIP